MFGVEDGVDVVNLGTSTLRRAIHEVGLVGMELGKRWREVLYFKT